MLEKGNGKRTQISSKVPWKIKGGDFKGEGPTNIRKPRPGGKCAQGSNNLERFDEQTYNMMVDIGKNVVYCRQKFVGGLNMNDFGTQNSPSDIALMKAKITDKR